MNPFKVLLWKKRDPLDGLLYKIRTSDTFVVSFPKSGNTWLRFILANAMTSDFVSFKNLNHFVPGLYNYASQINACNGPRFIKCHEASFQRFPRCVAIVRDVRDVLLSYYYYQRDLGMFRGNLNRFVLSKHYQAGFGSWRDHCNALLREARQRPDKIWIVRYEDLYRDPEKYISQLLQFCNLSSYKTIEEIVSLTSFAALQANESEHGRVFDNEISFFRQGKPEQWKTGLPADLAKILETENKEILDLLGYT